jgi:nitric oxide reductase activation protein
MITENVFPHLFNWRRWSTDLTDLHPQISEMLTKGVTLGKKLGRKLQIRGESRDTKWSRLDSGRIDKRLISELGFGNDRVFSTTFVEKFSDAFLHISIDASGSMNGEKWDNTMISTIAICKAASMIDNVDVVVSFRTTHESGGRTSRTSNYLPLVAIGYDSRVDKFSKILRHFGWINPGGTTPEGLCFEAIMNEIVPTVRDRDSYFLNLSDGMPMFSNSELYYHDTEALNHTKKMVDEIRKKGVKILSYYVGDEYDRSRSMEDFKTMYGKDASFINVTNVMEVSKSMNKMFLEKSNG